MGLDAIEHIVVLLLENRSFDHMLGYLSLEQGRTDVDGLKPGLKNTWKGTDYAVRHLAERTLPADPCHEGPRCVDVQIANNCNGFVESFAAVYPADPGLIMGYYNKDDVPVFHQLAQQFTICDRWFSSVAGPTIPNRMYAVAGRSTGARSGRRRARAPVSARRATRGATAPRPRAARPSVGRRSAAPRFRTGTTTAAAPTRLGLTGVADRDARSRRPVPLPPGTTPASRATA